MTDLTPAETLQAAVEVLVKLRDESTPGDWDILDGEDRFIAWHEDPASIGFEYIVGEPVEFERKADASLIVTLHATIDAQIAILNCCLNMDGRIGLRWNPLDHTALALAASILGAVQA